MSRIVYLSFYEEPPFYDVMDLNQFSEYISLLSIILKKNLSEELIPEVFTEQVSKLLDISFEINEKSYVRMINSFSECIEIFKNEEDKKLKGLKFYNTSAKHYAYGTRNPFPLIPLKLMKIGAV